MVLDGRAILDLERRLRSEISELTRKFASHEAGPVGIRLRQIADVFEGGK